MHAILTGAETVASNVAIDVRLAIWNKTDLVHRSRHPVIRCVL
jgi:hypothetical protein